MNIIGKNIRDARKAIKMSQDELAEAIGANRVTISKYENGNYLPSVPALERLAVALHTTTNQLQGKAENPPTENRQRIDEKLVEMLVNLQPNQVQRVKDFVAGMKANRTD